MHHWPSNFISKYAIKAYNVLFFRLMEKCWPSCQRFHSQRAAINILIIILIHSVVWFSIHNLLHNCQFFCPLEKPKFPPNQANDYGEFVTSTGIGLPQWTLRWSYRRNAVSKMYVTKCSIGHRWLQIVPSSFTCSSTEKLRFRKKKSRFDVQVICINKTITRCSG